MIFIYKFKGTPMTIDENVEESTDTQPGNELSEHSAESCDTFDEAEIDSGDYYLLLLIIYSYFKMDNIIHVKFT